MGMLSVRLVVWLFVCLLLLLFAGGGGGGGYPAFCFVDGCIISLRLCTFTTN